MTGDELTLESVSRFGVHYARCDACQFGVCPGGWHSWAGPEDIEHAKLTGQPDPSVKVCACPCRIDPPRDEAPDPFDLVPAAFDVLPCGTCGEIGACAYDSEGRPLIHTSPECEGD